MRGAGTTSATDPQAASLLDSLLPKFDFRNHHSILVPAGAARVMDALESMRLDHLWVARVLFRLRGLQTRAGTWRAALGRQGFTLLAERPGEEIVVGTAGRFWAPREQANMKAPRDAHAFVDFNEPRCAKAAMSFRVRAVSDATTRLETETRVQCTDAAAYRRFALYWTLIKPFSGLIRRVMLRDICRRATQPAGAAER